MPEFSIILLLYVLINQAKVKINVKLINMNMFVTNFLNGC